MRVLVSGASGFIGANLVRRLLADGHSVSVVLRHRAESWRLAEVIDHVTVHDGSITDRDVVDTAFRTSRPEWVFHCAAHGAYSFERDVASILRTNVIGIGNLLEAAAAYGCDAFVNSGSSSEYGDLDHPARESEATYPNSFYAVSKVAATQLCDRFAVERRVPTCTLRLYSAYGPWEDSRRIMPTMCAHAADGRFPRLADPWVVRDYIYVDDVVDAYMKVPVADVQPGAIYNVGTGVETTLADLASKFQEIYSIADEPEFGAYETRQWDTRRWVADTILSASELQWTAGISVSEGISKFSAWIAENPDRYRLSTAAV